MRWAVQCGAHRIAVRTLAASCAFNTEHNMRRCTRLHFLSPMFVFGVVIVIEICCLYCMYFTRCCVNSLNLLYVATHVIY